MNLTTGLECTQENIRGTARPSCIYEYKAFIGLYLVPKSFRMTAANIADLQNFLLSKLTADNVEDRIYFIGRFYSTQPSYSDAEIKTRDDGSTKKTRDAKAGWKSMFDNGGGCYGSAIDSFDNLHNRFDIMIVNNEQTLITEKTYNTTSGAYEAKGFELSDLSTDTPIVGSFTDSDVYAINYQVAEPKKFFNSNWVIASEFDHVNDLPGGITEVHLTQLTALSGTGGVTVSANAGCSNSNLATGALSSTFANVARWSATNWTTGAAITISSVAVSANGSGFDFDLDSSDTDYPASGSYVALKLVAVSTLAAAGLEYYESYAENHLAGYTGVELLIEVP